MTDANGGGQGVGVGNGVALHKGGGSRRLEAHHPGQATAALLLMVFTKAHPIGGDVARVAHGHTEPVGGIPQGVHHLKGSGFLPL